MAQPVQPQPVGYAVTVGQSNETTRGASYPHMWPDHPIEITCHDCGKVGVTNVHETTGGLAWILFFICFICGLWLGCCCVPFCIPACNDQEHRCSHCHHAVGYRKSM